MSASPKIAFRASSMRRFSMLKFACTCPLALDFEDRSTISQVYQVSTLFNQTVLNRH